MHVILALPCFSVTHIELHLLYRCDHLMGDSSGEAEAWANAGQSSSHTIIQDSNCVCRVHVHVA